MTAKTDLLFQNFDHVAIAVRDIDDAARKMEDVLGISATVTRDMNEDGYRAAIVPLRTGRLILIQPTDDKGAIAEFLNDRGEGLHHISFGVENVARARAEIEERGGVLPADSPRPRPTGISDFVDASVTGGVPVEFEETTLFTPGTSRDIGLHHVTIRTYDVGTAAATWQRLFRMPLKRRAVSEGFGMDTAWLDAGDAEVEFAQDLREDGPVARALKLMGEGLHAVVLESDDPEAVEERARSAGARVIVDDGDPTNVLRAIHPLDFLGTLVLISQRDAAHAGMTRTQPADGGAH